MSDFGNSLCLVDKRILVTGATGYLGRSIALGLAELGATILVNGRDSESVGSFVEELRYRELRALPAVFDVNDEDQLENWCFEFGPQALHGLVNNAYSGGGGTVESSNAADYRASFEVSVVAAQRLVQFLLPNFRMAAITSGGASVVNIASMYGMVIPDQRIYSDSKSTNPPFYGASKAALLQWTRYAACEFGFENIRFNSISPGPFPSTNVKQDNPEFVSTLAGKVPMGRVGDAEELCGPVAFLLSSSSSFVNGSNLVVDGGWTCW